MLVLLSRLPKETKKKENIFASDQQFTKAEELVVERPSLHDLICET